MDPIEVDQTFLPPVFKCHRPIRATSKLNQLALSKTLINLKQVKTSKRKVKQTVDQLEIHDETTRKLLQLLQTFQLKMSSLNNCRKLLWEKTIEKLKSQIQQYIIQNFENRKIQKSFTFSDEDLDDTQNDLSVTDRQLGAIPTAVFVTGSLDMRNIIEIFDIDSEIMEINDPDNTRPIPKFVQFEPVDSKTMKAFLEKFSSQIFLDSDADFLSFKAMRKDLRTFHKILDLATEKYHRYNPLTIVFKNIEQFNSCHLTNFLYLLTENQDRIPITIVFCVSTTLNSQTFTKLISSHVLSKLNLTKFTLNSPTEILNDILDIVMFGRCIKSIDGDEDQVFGTEEKNNDNSFQTLFLPGPSLLKELNNRFLSCDYNVENYFNSLTALLINFYLKKLDRIRLKSLNEKCSKTMNAIESSIEEELTSYDENSKHFMVNHQKYFLGIKLLYQFAYPDLGRHLRNCYDKINNNSTTSTDFASNDEYKKYIHYLKKCDAPFLYKKAQLLLKLLTDDEVSVEHAGELVDKLVDFLNLFETDGESSVPVLKRELPNLTNFLGPKWAKNSTKNDTKSDEEHDKEYSSPIQKSKKPSTSNIQIKNTNQLRKQIEAKMNKNKISESNKIFEKLNNFEKIRLRIIEIFDQIFNIFLSLHPKILKTEYNQIYADGDDFRIVNYDVNCKFKMNIKKQMTIDYDEILGKETNDDKKNIKKSRTTAKKKASSTEKNTANLKNQRAIFNFMFNENQQKCINLYNWLENISAQIGEEEISEETHLFFMRTISELKFLGLVSDSSRRVDHVDVLSWAKF